MQYKPIKIWELFNAPPDVCNVSAGCSGQFLAIMYRKVRQGNELDFITLHSAAAVHTDWDNNACSPSVTLSGDRAEAE